MKAESIVLTGTAFIYDFSSSEDSQYLTLFGKSPDNSPLTFRVTLPSPETPTGDPSPYDDCTRWITYCPDSYVEWQSEIADGDIVIDPTFSDTPTRWTPQLSTASLDIETSCFGNKLYCIGIHFQDGDHEISKVFMLAKQRVQDPKIEYFDSEKTLLEQFCSWFRQINPDILIGWHIHEFDIKFIAQRCKENDVEFDLGRHHIKWIDASESRKQRPSIPGRVILDGAECLDVLGISLDGFSLEAVSQQFLGEGKLIRPEDDKVYEIERMYRHDPHALGLYNLKDCELVTRIMQTLNIVPTLVHLCTHLKCPLGYTITPKKALDVPYARAFSTLPLPQSIHSDPILSEPSHFRIKAVPGHHEKIAEIRIPFLIALAAELTGVDTLHTASQGEKAIYPDLFLCTVAALSDQPETQKRVQFYLHSGFESLTLSTSYRYFSNDTKIHLKTAGTILLRALVTTLRDHDIRPLLHHNGTLIVTDALRPLTTTVLDEVSASIQLKLKRFYPNCTPFNLAISDTYDHVYIPSVRHWNVNRTPHFFTGRSSENGLQIDHIHASHGKSGQPALLNSVIQGLFETLFQKRPLLSWLEGFIQTLESGELDSQLIFSKRIKKSPRRYGLMAPPHIVAARISKRFSGKVQYVYSLTGPHPISVQPYTIDHQHYIKTVIRPILEIISDEYAIDPDNLPNTSQSTLF